MKTGVILLYANANINIKQDHILQPLYIAAEKGNSQLTQLLLDKGANVYYRTSKGKTALTIAIKNKNTECISILNKHIEILEKAADDTALSLIIEEDKTKKSKKQSKNKKKNL